MLLLYDNPASIAQFQKMSPEEMQKATEKYMAWGKKPFTGDSKRLAEDTGKVIRAERGSKPRTTDGPLQRNQGGAGRLLHD